ncbi:MAG: hypothetical protein AAF975_02975 [Spirochaetota bacterium]
MKKFNFALSLLLLFSVGVQNLAAQDSAKEGTLTAKINPSGLGQGRLYFSGNSTDKGDLATEGDAEARAKFEADYNGIAGVKVEIEGEVNKAKSNAVATHFGFGDNAYAYVHLLQTFGIDKKIFDVYVQSGRFNVAFDNAKDGGQGKWLADVDELTRDKNVNMQLDLKILDMLTVRYGVGFAPIDQDKNDMGWGILFSKSFGSHKIEASLAYVVDLSQKPYRTGTGKISDPFVYKPQDFDQLGLSVAYTGTFGSIVLTPFAAVRLKGLLAKTNTDYVRSYINPMLGWSAGVKFQLRDAANTYDMVGAGIDLGGQTRSNRDYTNPDGTVVKQNYFANDGLGGFGLKVWSDALRSIMGKNYLHAWARVRLDINDPKINNGLDIKRKGYLTSWAIGVEQYLINVSNASIKFKAGFTMEDTTPYYAEVRDGKGYINTIYPKTTTKAYSTPLYKTYLDLGLEASFTSIFTATVK